MLNVDLTALCVIQGRRVKANSERPTQLNSTQLKNWKSLRFCQSAKFWTFSELVELSWVGRSELGFTDNEIYTLRGSGTHAGNRCVRTCCGPCGPVTLTLTRWPSYTNLTGCAIMSFLRQGLLKWSSDRQTDTIEMQGLIIHCAGCTMGGGHRRKGAPAAISFQIFTTLFWRLNVQCMLKRND